MIGDLPETTTTRRFRWRLEILVTVRSSSWNEDSVHVYVRQSCKKISELFPDPFPACISIGDMIKLHDSLH